MERHPGACFLLRATRSELEFNFKVQQGEWSLAPSVRPVDDFFGCWRLKPRGSFRTALVPPWQVIVGAALSHSQTNPVVRREGRPRPSARAETRGCSLMNSPPPSTSSFPIPCSLVETSAHVSRSMCQVRDGLGNCSSLSFDHNFATIRIDSKLYISPTWKKTSLIFMSSNAQPENPCGSSKRVS